MHIGYDVYKDLAQERMERLQKEVKEYETTAKKKKRNMFSKVTYRLFKERPKIRMKRKLKTD